MLPKSNDFLVSLSLSLSLSGEEQHADFLHCSPERQAFVLLRESNRTDKL